MEIDLTQIIVATGGGTLTVIVGAVKLMGSLKKTYDGKIEELEEKLEALASKEEVRNSFIRVWSSMEKRRDDMDRWRSEVDRAMVTKEDLRSMESRLIGAIRSPNSGLK